MHPRTASLIAREQLVQRSPEWYAARRDLLTASDVASALDIKPYASFRGSAREQLMHRKLADEPINNMFVHYGTKYEDEARDWAAAAMGETIVEVGLVRHAELPWLGASPDGVTLSGKLVEIKCPFKRAIEPGRVPSHYIPQVLVQMEVADVDQTIFVQYKPAAYTMTKKAVLDIVVVERNRDWFERHVGAMHSFWKEYMAARAGMPSPRKWPRGPMCLIEDDMYADLGAPTFLQP